MWKYSLSEKKLTSPNGHTWHAVSGPRGKGHLPIEKYTIGSTTTIGYDARFYE